MATEKQKLIHIRCDAHLMDTLNDIIHFKNKLKDPISKQKLLEGWIRDKALVVHAKLRQKVKKI